MPTRRELLAAMAATAAALTVPVVSATRAAAVAWTGQAQVGLGLWRKFDVEPGSSAYRAAGETLRAFAQSGGRLIDSSPMYGRSSTTVGEFVRSTSWGKRLFFATKLWARGARAGEEQLRDEQAHFGRLPLDLVQVHNLNDLGTQLSVLRAAKAAGGVRMIGASHYQSQAHDDLRDVMRREALDAVQVNYSILEPEAEDRLLPAVRDQGAMLLINRCFADGALFERVRGQSLPGFATELGMESWAEYFLRWVLSHEAVDVAITGTGNPRHIEQNLRIATLPVLDAATRKRMAEFVRAL